MSTEERKEFLELMREIYPARTTNLVTLSGHTIRSTAKWVSATYNRYAEEATNDHTSQSG